MHHLQEVQGMSLRTAEYLVFDEADRLFEMGFADQLKQARWQGGVQWRRIGECTALHVLLFSHSKTPPPPLTHKHLEATRRCSSPPPRPPPLPPIPPAPTMLQILSHVGPARQTLLFSATMPSALAEFARAGLKEPELVRLDADTKISPDLALAFFTVRWVKDGGWFI